MTKAECRAAILNEYDRWSAQQEHLPDKVYDRAFNFYFTHLEKTRGDLLKWRRREGEDPWQDVKGWITRREGGR